MASRTLHLAVTECLRKTLPFADPLRLRIGTILPDAPNTPQTAAVSHFTVFRPDGKKQCDLLGFRKEYGEAMLADDLYLGYYLHIVQDTVFRRFAYDEHHWNPHIPGNPQRLHGDYARLNPIVIAKFDLQNDLCVPDGFENEPLQARFRFDLPAYLEEYRRDFAPVAASEAFFFTEEMADAYIREATDVCRGEIMSLRSGSEPTEITNYAWNSKQ